MTRYPSWALVALLAAAGCVDGPVAPAAAPRFALHTAAPPRVLNYHGGIPTVQTLFTSLAIDNGWSVTHVTPTAFAALTAAELATYDVIAVVSGGAGSQCGSNQWGFAGPDYAGLLGHSGLGPVVARGRTVITGIDADWHAINQWFEPWGPAVRRLLVNAVTWVGEGPSTGIVALADGETCSGWWLQPGSVLLGSLTAPGVGVIYGGYGVAAVTDPTHPVTAGLPPSIDFCCHHARIAGDVPGFTVVMRHPTSGAAATLVSEGVRAIDIDVHPGSERNPLNLHSRGVVPVAVLSDGDFDAAAVDVATARLGDAGLTQRGPAERGAAEDVDGDGDIDLLLFFRMPLLVEAGALLHTTTRVALEAETGDGRRIRGENPVTIVP